MVSRRRLHRIHRTVSHLDGHLPIAGNWLYNASLFQERGYTEKIVAHPTIAVHSIDLLASLSASESEEVGKQFVTRGKLYLGPGQDQGGMWLLIRYKYGVRFRNKVFRTQQIISTNPPSSVCAPDKDGRK